MPNEQHVTTRTLGGFAWSFLGAGGQALVNAIVVVILARLLTPAEYGVVGAALIVVNFVQVFTQLGVGPALVQLHDIQSRHIHVGFLLSSITGMSFGIGVAVLAVPIAEFFSMPALVPVLRVMALVFPIAGIGAVGRSLLQRDMRFKDLAKVDIISFAIGYGATGVTLAALGLGVWALVGANLGQTLLSTALLVYTRRDAIGFAFSRAESSTLLNYGVGHSLARIANYLANQADNLVVGRFLGADALGMYTRAYQLMMTPTNLVGTVLDRVMFPAMASVQNEKDRLARGFFLAFSGVTMVTMPMATALLVTAPELVEVLLGPNWAGVTTPFQILISILMFRTAYKISDSLARATGAVYRRAWRQWIYACSVFLGAYVGFRLGGLVGVAIGVGVSVILNFGLMLDLSLSLTGISLATIMKMILRHTAVAVVTGSAAHLIRVGTISMGLPAPVVLALSAVGAVVTWFIWLLVAPSVFGQEGKFAIIYAQRVLGNVKRRSGRRAGGN